VSGLALRTGLILSAALLLLALAALGALRYQQEGVVGALRLSFPQQAAALVELVEQTDPRQLPLVLRALDSPVLHVTVSEREPPDDPRNRPLPGMSWLVRNTMDQLGGRPVKATGAGAGESISALPGADRPLRLVVGLRDGRFLTIEARAGAYASLIRLRLLLLVLPTLLLIGGGALWLLRRQIRPLEQLAQAVERFGEDLHAGDLDECGAVEVRRLVAAFNRMRTRIRALVDGRTRMLAAISHDLGTYLTRLRLRAEFIDDARQRDRAILDIEEMDALMKDTLTLARIEQEPDGGEVIDLERLVRRQVENFCAAGERVQLVAAVPSQVRGRAGALSRVLSNLIANALKHAGGAEVTLAAAGGSAEILVEDRGRGIPPELRELVLEPFYRRDQSRNLNAAGFGLGLSIVAEIVRGHRGTLALEDRAGGGLRVQVRLPAAAQAETEPGPRESGADRAIAAQARTAA